RHRTEFSMAREQHTKTRRRENTKKTQGFSQEIAWQSQRPDRSHAFAGFAALARPFSSRRRSSPFGLPPALRNRRTHSAFGPLAAQAGLDILRQGGNAIDAAVATGAVLDVTSQNDTGIGGDLFALVWSAKDKKLYALNSAGWAPKGWTPEFFTQKLAVKSVP